jgi:hypothetical protein
MRKKTHSPTVRSTVRVWLVATGLKGAREGQILDRLNSDLCMMWRAGTNEIAVPFGMSTDEYTPLSRCTGPVTVPS